MKRGKVTALVMAFIMAVSVLASPVTMLNTNAAVKAKKITMAKKATLEVGAKKKLKVTVKPAKAKVKITFRTSNSRIAKVNSKGVVKGVKAGQATITAKAKVGKKVLKAKQKITVKKKAKQTPAAIKITSLTVKKYDVTINEGNIETMAVTVLPANATNKKLQYTTSDNNVVAVSANLHVKPIIVAVQNYTRATVKGLVPTLPSTLAGILPDGTSYGAYPVTWDSIKESDLENVGDVVKVKGKVDVEGKEMTATATIRVAEGEVKEAVNIAPKYKTLKESCGEPADNLLSIVDGVNNVLDRPNMRWTNWNDHLLNSSPTITFTWDEVYELASIKAWFFGDMNVKAPESVTIAVSEDGENFKEVEFTHNDYQVNQKSELVFNEVQKAKALRFTMKQVGTGYVGLTELEIWTSEKGYTSNKTAELEELKVDGTAVEGFAADKYEYTVVVDKVDQAVVDAAAKDNASVMVVPFNKDNVVKVIVTSEDGKTTNTYKVKLIAKDQIADKVLIEKVEGEIKQAESLKKDDYTNSSYAEYEKALKEVKAVIAKEIVTKDEVNAALEKLQTARGNLVKVTKPAPDTNKNPEKPSANKPETGVPSVGMLIKYKKAIYKVREVNATGGTVMLVKRNSKKAKFVIPATIKSGNYTFKVTSIANKAFKGDKKLKKVVIGKNVQVIGKRAFEKAKNLRSITIKSVSLKKVGRSAFKGIHAKAKIKVPAKKLKAYKRLLKKKGQKSSVKIIK